MTLVLFLRATSPAAERFGFPVLEPFANADIDAGAPVMGMVENTSGELHFAAGGLLTYDGERWTVSRIPGSFRLRSLQWGRDGRLWAAATNDIGWFRRGTDGRWDFTSLREHLAADDARFGEAWDVFPRGDGATFVTENRILHWDGRAFASWRAPHSRRPFVSRAGASAFVHYLAGGLYELGPDGPRLFIPRSILGNAAVLWIERRRNDWLLGTSLGLFVFDGVALKTHADEAGDFIRRHILTCIARLPDGRLFVGTMKGGGAFFSAEGRLEEMLGEREGLPSANLWGASLDRDGNLWIGSATHLVRVPLAPTARLFDERAGIPERPVFEIAQWRDQVVVANDKGAYALDSDRQRFALVEALRGHVNDLVPQPDGLLSAGYRGVRRWDGRAVATVHDTDADSFTVAPTHASGSERFVVDNRAILSLSPSGKPTLVVEDLPAIATSLAEDAENTLWLGTFGRGLIAVRRTPGAPPAIESPATSFASPAVLGHVRVRAARDGGIFVFGDNGGWTKPAGHARFVPIADLPLRPLAAVSAVTDDGSVWLLYDRDGVRPPLVGRISPSGAGARWQPAAADSLWTAGTLHALHAESASGHDAVLWIGGSRGVLRHVVTATAAAVKPRPPLVRALAQTAGSTARLPVTAALPYQTDNIELEFAAPEFSRRHALRIESKLEGLNEDWTPVGAGARRTLSGLRDGNYRVRARVVSEAGATSDETVVAFGISAPWWRSGPAYASAVLLVLALAYGAYRWRVHALERRNRELEENVRLRTRELEAANAAKTEFVANMSHDIRNPLNGIVGLALALEDTRLDRGQREIVATLRECTTYLSTLVDDVLDFASIEAGRVELRPGPFSPAELLRSIATTLRPEASARGATLAIECAPGIPALLLGDAGRIQQILVNYVSNALKYAGGKILLSVARPTDAPGEIEFSVHDRGPGIAPEAQATLFAKFTRLQRPHEQDIPGTGLGLAACRLLADIMGGSVGVESQLGAGARFFLRLPLGVASEPESAPPPADLPNSTVLLVEDTDYNALAARAVLARLGLACERARTGEEAVRMFGEKRYNVVLLDRNLPDLDGAEVARRLRGLEGDGAPAVLLAVTAYCTAEDRALCLAAGMDAFVGKPLTPEKLRRVLIAAGRRLLAAATVEAANGASSEPVDLSLLSYLSDDSEDSLAAQVARFLETLSALESELADAWRREDFAALAVGAHRLQGHAKMVGGNALSAAALRLEGAARSRDERACREGMRAVDDEIRALTAAMRRRSAPLSTA